METSCQPICVTSDLIAFENKSVLLLSLPILKDQHQLQNKDRTLLDVSGILTIEKRNKSVLSKKPI